MKNKIICLLVFILFIVGIIGAYIYIYSKSLPKISYQEFEQKLNENESYSIIYYTKKDCELCKELNPIIREEAKKLNLDIYNLSYDNIDNLESLNQYNIKKVPSIIVIDNGKTRIYDNLNTSNILDILNEKDNPIIDRPETLTDISYEDIQKKMNLNLDFILYIGRNDCPDCQEFEPIIKEKISSNANCGVYYWDIKEIRDKSKEENASQEDIDFFEKIKEEFDIDWVPCVYHIVNGKLVAKYEYLDIDFYLLQDEQRKQALKQAYIDVFDNWIKECNQTKIDLNNLDLTEKNYKTTKANLNYIEF